ncbi:MAG TPA: ATP-binding protein [Candidatus Nitrosopolaris sp.]|nr:ATP-binding protein [Candidatus Nitrosopolaris sp.]
MNLRQLIGLSRDRHPGVGQEKDKIFGDVVGYDDIKRVFRMALKSDEPIHVLLVGPPASAKTMFLEALMNKLGDKQAYFAIGSSSTKAGVLNTLFMKEPKYLMVDEIDKMPVGEQASLLGLMETGELVETKVSKTRSIKLKTWVFATANTTTTLSKPLLTRFMVFSLRPYTYEDFEEVTIHLLGRRYNMKPDLAIEIASAVWHKMGSPNIRQCIKIAKMTKKKEDVEWLIDTIKKYQDRGEDWNE